jgi:hypothetical protein
MFNSDTELIIPVKVFPSLRDVRGEKWQKLVDMVSSLSPESSECTALVMMLARMNGCISCNADSYRAMKGCSLCARQSIRRYRGSDDELAEQFRITCQEVNSYLMKNLGSKV